jgi:hypothetical protein
MSPSLSWPRQESVRAQGMASGCLQRQKYKLIEICRLSEARIKLIVLPSERRELSRQIACENAEDKIPNYLKFQR